MKIPNQGKYDRLVIFIKQLILFSWQLIEDNLQISINAENSGHLNFPKYFDISLSNLQSQTFRFKHCTFFAKNAHLFPFMQKKCTFVSFCIHTYFRYILFCDFSISIARGDESFLFFSKQMKY